MKPNCLHVSTLLIIFCGFLNTLNAQTLLANNVSTNDDGEYWYLIYAPFTENNRFVLSKNDNELTFHSLKDGVLKTHKKIPGSNGKYLYSKDYDSEEISFIDDAYLINKVTKDQVASIFGPSSKVSTRGYVKISATDIANSNKYLKDYNLNYIQALSFNSVFRNTTASLYTGTVKNDSELKNKYFAHTWKLNSHGLIYLNDFHLSGGGKRKEITTTKECKMDYKLTNNSLDYLLIDVEILSRGYFDYYNWFTKEHLAILIHPQSFFKGVRSLSEEQGNEDDFRFIIKSVKKVNSTFFESLVRTYFAPYDKEANLQEVVKVMNDPDAKPFQDFILKSYESVFNKNYIPKILTSVEFEPDFDMDFPSNVNFVIHNSSDVKLKIRYQLGGDGNRIESTILEPNKVESFMKVYHKLQKNEINIKIIDVAPK